MGHLGNLKWECLTHFTRRGANIYARCLRCQRRTTFDAKRLYRFFVCRRWSTNLYAVRSRLYCIRCQRRPDRLGPSRDAHDAPPFLPSTEDEWKRLVRRLRG